MNQTNSPTRILVGVDETTDAKLAFACAINRAIMEHAVLIIASVLETSNMNVYEALSKDFMHDQRDRLKATLDGYVRTAKAAGVKDVRYATGEGDPGKVIVNEIIPVTKPDILIIGSLAQRGPRKYLPSRAAYIVKHAPISVLVVR